MCDCEFSPWPPKKEKEVGLLLPLTSNSGGFPLGKRFSSPPAKERLWFSPLPSQRAWKADCVLAVPSCSGSLCCSQSSDVAAIVADSELKLRFSVSIFCSFWTVSRDLVLSQPAGLTSEWTLLAIHITGIFSCFLKHMVLCKLKLTVRVFFSSFFIPPQISDYSNHFHSVLHPHYFLFFFILNPYLILQTSDRSLWFLDLTFTSVLVNVLGDLIGPVML